jgi:TPR repeat protein
LSGELPRDVPRAVTLLEAAAASDNPYALEKLGEMYLKGEEVAADPEKARSYLERAIMAGRTEIRFKLGRALIRGQGVAKDMVEGAKLLEAAARTDPWAQLALGGMLLSGELPRDVPRAVTLLEAAAASDNPYALEKLGKMYLKGEEVAADPEKARSYLERAAAAKH